MERKYYDAKDIMKKFDKLTPEKKIVILEKALKRALNNQAGTREYAIATSMGYGLEDDVSYFK